MALDKITELNVSGALANVAVTFPSGTFEKPVPLVFRPSRMQYLLIKNPDGATGPLSVVIKGDKASATYSCPGTGKTHDLSAGFTLQVKAGEVQAICLRQIQAYLVGKVLVTATGDSAATAGAVVVS